MAEATASGSVRYRSAVRTREQILPHRHQPQPARIFERRDADERAEVLAQRSFGNIADGGKLGHGNGAPDILPQILDGFLDVAGDWPAP
jgi:hypothetical protein